MWHVIGCLTEQHDLRLVALAGLMCLFACATAMSMLARGGPRRTVWIAGAGLVAGSGIWATHFIAELAYQAGFPVGYDIGLTLLSILVAIALCSAGFAVALRPRMALVGGGLVGAAIGAMHYIGMSAIRAPALAIWDWRYVTASMILGILPMAFGMDLVLRRRTFRAYAIGAVIFTLAICTMHFTGMSAVSFVLYPVAVPDAVMDPASLAVVVAAVAALIVGAGLAVALVDQHLALRAGLEAERLRRHIAELESTKTELEQTSSDLRAALAAADAANTAKSQFLAAMSHELRTPLNAVIGFSQVIEQEAFGPLGDERYRGYIADIHKSGAHLLDLINDILDLSRLDAGKCELQDEEFAIPALADDVLRMLSEQAREAGVTLLPFSAAALPYVRADQRRIRQVLLNLVSNAVKFTPAGGQVGISAEAGPAGLSLVVRDTGIGIAPADIATAFERFGQVDSRLARRYQGTGLGLPLSRQLMELHGGTLVLRSEVNVGTTVTLTLPPERLKTAAATGRFKSAASGP